MKHNKSFLLFFAILGFLVVSSSVQALPFLVEDTEGHIVVSDDATDMGFAVYNVYGDSPSGYNSEFYGYEGDWSGYYLGTFSGNTEGAGNAMFVGAIAYYLNGMSFTVDGISVTPSGTDTVESNELKNEALIVSYSPDYKTGTWSIDTALESRLVSFYAVKAGTEFALYFLYPASTSGDWSTEHLTVGRNDNQPEISHLTVTYSNATAPVPEPATMVLLGVGLVGFAGLGRKKIKSSH